MALVVGTVYTPSYVVSVDGVTLGVVSDPEVFEGAMERVEARASDILGYDYTLDNAVTYDFALTEKDKLSNVGDFETYLFDQIGEGDEELRAQGQRPVHRRGPGRGLSHRHAGRHQGPPMSTRTPPPPSLWSPCPSAGSTPPPTWSRICPPWRPA